MCARIMKAKDGNYRVTRASLERRLFTTDARVEIDGVVGVGILQGISREDGSGKSFSIIVRYGDMNRVYYVRTD